MDFQKDIDNCLTTLQRGGVILYPTDTIWGLGCDAMNTKAVEKIFEIKKRSTEKSCIVLVSDEQMLTDFAVIPPSYHRLKNNYQRPVTFIFPEAKQLTYPVTAADGSVAIRVVKDLFCQQLIKAFKNPIVSTSANVSGTPSPQNFSAISDEIKLQTDYLVQHRQDEKTEAVASTIIQLLADGFKIIRG